MRALIIVPLFCISIALQAQTARQVNANELEQFLAGAQHSGDADLAVQLSEMELTERVNSARLSDLEAKCRGTKSVNALIALADESAFLLGSPSEPSGSDPPSDAEQKEIAAKLLAFVLGINHQMPNFIAARTTLRFQDWPKGLQIGQMVPARTIPLEFSSHVEETVTYRNGQEIVSKPKVVQGDRHTVSNQGLSTWGLFGPVLTTILTDASRSTFVWSRWEKDGNNRLAVFRFAVPMEKSTYEVKFCCVPSLGNMVTPINRVSAYHGEWAVNPSDGAIVHLTLIADLDQGDLSTMMQESLEGRPLSAADLAVEYGPVEIAGKEYTCPIKAVARSQARTLLVHKGKGYELGPLRTYLNDVSFTGYHIFRSESRILTGYTPQ